MNLNNQFDTLVGLTLDSHILARVRESEYATITQAMKNIEGGEVAEVFESLGALDFQAIDDDGLLRVVVSARDLFDVENPVTETGFGVHAHVLGQNTSGVPQFYLSADDGHAYMINAEVSGTITIGTGSSAGGWFINATQIFNDSISLDSALPAIKIGAATDYLTGSGIFMGKSSSVYKMHVGDPSGHYLAFDGVGLSVSGQWIRSAGMNPALQDWRTNIVFSSASDTQVNWISGTIILSDGTTYSIVSGNTGTMSALTYVYLDVAVSTTVLQKTTTYSTATGDGKVLIAAAINASAGASVIPYGGQQPIINGVQITALSILAGNIAAGAVTASKISVVDLAAVNASTGSLTVTGTISMINASKQILSISASDGSTKFGSDLSAPGTTALVIAGAALTYNSESLAAGAVLFGDNSTSKANMLWDSSMGQLKFRGGVTTQVYVDTDGSIAAANGNIKINLLGMRYYMDGVFEEFNTIDVGGTNSGSLYVREVVKNIGLSEVNVNVVSLPTVPDAGMEGTLGTYWTILAGSPVYSATQQHSGAKSLKLAATADNIISQNYISIGSYSGFLDLWLYGATNAQLRVKIKCYSAGSVYLGDANVLQGVSNANGSWKRYIIGGQYPTGTTKVKFDFLSANGVMYIDDLVFYDGIGYQLIAGADGLNGSGLGGQPALGDFSSMIEFSRGIALPFGTFTPAITFATPGDLNVGYGGSPVQEGYWNMLERNLIRIEGRLITTTFTHTTAAGAFRVTGLPFPVQSGSANSLSEITLTMRGYTLAGWTKVGLFPINGQTYMQIIASGSGVAPAALVPASIPSGGTIDLRFNGIYRIG